MAHLFEGSGGTAKHTSRRPTTHIILAGRQVDGLHYARSRNLPNPAFRTNPTDRTVIVTPGSGARALYGLAGPISVHYAHGAGRVPGEAFDVIARIQATTPPA